LAPCDEGEERNPATNRCRKTTLASSILTPCDPGEERNPATNRCRKISAASSSLTPCDPGEERNPETNRCRKVQGASTTNAKATGDQNSRQTDKPPNLNMWILATLAVLASGYGVYEYRSDLLNLFQKFRAKFRKPSPP
jgi:hypothetical protein